MCQEETWKDTDRDSPLAAQISVAVVAVLVVTTLLLLSPGTDTDTF